MATITVDTFLDGGTARTAGETWTINGAKLTIRTDTRWHANSPASMTGSLGATTISASLGGGFFVEGRNVRWMPFDTGSGTVPAIGTTITQGGVSGYLLGVWADYVSAPIAVGGAMPATGYLKFREVSGGAFSVGALTGISANATSTDVTGWMEIVLDQSTYFTNSALGSGFEAYGEWFYLDNASGSRGQILQAPTNGGGAGTTLLGIQVETSPGSDVYEWYPALNATGWATNALATDARAKFVQNLGSGQVRIGSDGTSNIGYLPASGCKIRIPNVMFRQCTTAARASNAAPSATNSVRPQFSFTNGGSYNASKIMSDQYVAATTPGVVNLTDSIFDSRLSFTGAKQPITLTRIAVSAVTTLLQNVLALSNVKKGFTCTDSVFVATGNTTCFSPSYATNISVSNNKFCLVFSKATSSTSAAVFDNTSGVVNNCKFWGGRIGLSVCNGLELNSVDYIDRTNGDMTTGTSGQLFDISTSSNILINGLTFGNNGEISNCANYGSIVSTSGGSNNIRVRNIGTRASPLVTNTNSANYPLVVLTSIANDSNIKVQRVYLNGTRNGIASISDYATTDVLMEHVYGTMNSTGTVNGTDLTVRACGITSAATTHANTLGSHWLDSFTSSTAGFVYLFFNDVSSKTAPYVTTSLAASSGLSGDGYIRMKSINDTYTIEMPYFTKGHTALANTAPTLSGTNTGNLTYTYQIDVGSGWNGTWKTLNASNLSSESVDASIGFKLKIKIVCATASTTNALYTIKIATVSTSTAQTDNLYPLDTVNLGFTNLVTGSEVRIYTGTDPATSVEIGGVESTSGSTFSITHDNAGQNGYIAIFAMGYQPIYLPYTFKAVDDSILIQQVVDRNYVNPV